MVTIPPNDRDRALTSCPVRMTGGHRQIVGEVSVEMADKPPGEPSLNPQGPWLMAVLVHRQ